MHQEAVAKAKNEITIAIVIELSSSGYTPAEINNALEAGLIEIATNSAFEDWFYGGNSSVVARSAVKEFARDIERAARPREAIQTELAL